MKIWAAVFVFWASFVSAHAAEFAVTSPVMSPSDGVISMDSRDTENGRFYFSFEVNDTFVSPGKWELSQNSSAAFATDTVNAGVRNDVRNSEQKAFGLTDLPDQTGNKQHTLTLKITDGSGVTDATQTFVYTLTVDGTPPAAPTGLAAVSANRSALLVWDVAAAGSTNATDIKSNVEIFKLYYKAGDMAPSLITDGSSTPAPISSSVLDQIEGIQSKSLTVDSRVDSMTVDGLTNGQQYSFVLVAIDHAGNDSGVAVDGSGTPVVAYANPETYYSFGELSNLEDRCFVVTAALGDKQSRALGPYRAFRDYVLLSMPGGKVLVRWYYLHGPRWAYWLRQQSAPVRVVAWGLAWSGAILLILMPLAMAAMVIRRVRRSAWLMMLFLGLLILPHESLAAHNWRDESETKVMRQHVRLSLSGFKPSATFARPGGGSVVTFEELYGKKPTVLTRVGYGWEFFRYAGVLAVEGDVGFWTQKGKSLDSQGVAHGGDLRDRMALVPVSAGLQYAFQYVFPQFVVPAIEAGASFWGISSTPPGKDVDAIQDFRYGWYWQGELRLLLDWMDPPTGDQFEFDFGVVDTHLVFGWREDIVDNFGRAKKGFNLSNRTIYGSLLFQF